VGGVTLLKWNKMWEGASFRRGTESGEKLSNMTNKQKKEENKYLKR